MTHKPKAKKHIVGVIKKGTPLDMQTAIDWHIAMGHTRKAAERLATREAVSMDTT